MAHLGRVWVFSGRQRCIKRRRIVGDEVAMIPKRPGVSAKWSPEVEAKRQTAALLTP